MGVLGGWDVTISQVTKVCLLKQKIYTVTRSEIIHTNRSIHIHDLKPYQLGHKNWHTPAFRPQKLAHTSIYLFFMFQYHDESQQISQSTKHQNELGLVPKAE